MRKLRNILGVVSLLAVAIFVLQSTVRVPARGFAPPTPRQVQGDVVVAVGDLGSGTNAVHVRDLTLRQSPEAIVHSGDLVYEVGTPDKFNGPYESLWGAQKSKLFPAMGNHEYGNATYPSGAGYLDYFKLPRYYSWDLVLPTGRKVHLLSINSNCGQWSPAPGCGVTQAMREWIRQDLAAYGQRCNIAYWHEPAFGSDVNYHTATGGKTAMRGVWETLQSRGVDMVIAAHAHNYQRYRDLDHRGVRTTAGMPSVIVGTGGKSRNAFSGRWAYHSALAAATAQFDGVLKMVFNNDATGWVQAYKTTTGLTLDRVSFSC